MKHVFFFVFFLDIFWRNHSLLLNFVERNFSVNGKQSLLVPASVLVVVIEEDVLSYYSLVLSQLS